MKRILWVLLLMIVLSSFVSAIDSTALASDTLAYYKAEEAGLSYVDSVAGTYTITKGDIPARVLGVIDYQWGYDGVSEYLVIGQMPTFTVAKGGFAMSFWFNDTNVGGLDNLLDFQNKTRILFQEQGNERINLRIRNGANAWREVASEVLQDEVRYHAVIQWNGTHIEMWLNNTLQGSTAMATMRDTYVADNAIGVAGNLFSAPYGGDIDEFAIFNRSLTTAEITYLYASHSPGTSQQYPYPGPSTPPGIIDAILTSGVLSACNMTPLSPICNTTDATYTMNLTTNETATCALNGTICSTTGTTLHVCTLATTAPEGIANFTANCTGDGGAGDAFTRQILVDTINPAITFNGPASQSYTNLSAIDINVTCSDTNGIINITMFVDSALNISNTTPVNNTPWVTAFTPALYQNYTIYFTCEDSVGDHNSNTTETRWYDFVSTTITMDIEGFNRSITAELGSILNITTNMTGSTVCIDVNHPAYGNNYSCGTSSTTFNLNISWFRRNAMLGTITCYQEFANVSTPCGGLDNGSYGWTGNWRGALVDYSEVIDGDWNTFGYCNFTERLNCTVYINYSTPNYASSSSTWRVKSGYQEDVIESNYPINFSCWGDALQFRMISDSTDYPDNLVRLECNDGPDWISIYNHDLSGTLPTIYEEGMNWEVSGTESNMYELNISGDSTVYITAHQYDDVVNLTLNITGYADSNGDYPKDVKIYIDDVLSNDIGDLEGTLTTFDDSTTYKNMTFTEEETQTVGYFRLPKDTDVTGAVFNVRGYNYTYYQATADNQTTEGNLFPGNNCDGIIRSMNPYYEKLNRTFVAWDIRIGDVARTNITSIGTCLSDNPDWLVFRMYSQGDTSGDKTPSCGWRSFAQCYNGGWQTLSSPGPTSTEGNVAGAGSKYFDNDYDTYSCFGRNYGYSPSVQWYYTCTDAAVDARIYEEGVWWNSAPKDSWIQIGFLNGTYNWNYTGQLIGSNGSISDFSSRLDDYLALCTADSDGFCDVPVYLYSAIGGIFEITDIEINYSVGVVNPVELDLNVLRGYLSNATNDTSIPITISSDEGSIFIDDIKYDYAGGNHTYLVTARNEANTTNTMLNITYYYSDWFLQLPPHIDYIEFIPKNPTEKNVSPYGQKTDRPILNITGTNYGGKLFNFTVNINESLSCGNDTLSLTNNKSAGVLLINNTWLNYTIDIDYLDTFDIYAWADFGCSYSTWYLWNPYWMFRGCCDGCDICDSSVTSMEWV